MNRCKSAQGEIGAMTHVIAVSAAVLLAGCATLTTEGPQKLQISVRDANGAALSGMQCVLENDRGRWTATTPATLAVERSNKDLMIRCDKSDAPSARARVISASNSRMQANWLISCGLGMLVDHWSGLGYDYPEVVELAPGDKVFGASAEASSK